MLALYDLEDNIVTIFETYKECAEYFSTSTNVIRSVVSKSRKGLIDKKRDIRNKKWYRLYKMEE